MKGLARQLVVVACAVGLVPTVAWAQQRSPLSRVSVGGFGGLTVTGAATDGAAAGQAGIRVTRHLVVFGEGGRFQNVLPPHREIGMEKSIAALYLKAPNTPVSVDAAYAANYGLGGARWLLGSFFVEGGVGAASVHTLIKHVVSNGTDVTSGFYSYSRGGPDFGAQTVSLLAFGGGLTKHVAGPVSLTAGYRYTHINTFAPASNANMTYLGVSFVR